MVIVILNWNGLSDTLACLASVFASQYSNFQVIVIDNNSANNELSIIKQQFPEITTIQNRKNLGFTGGCNLGIDYAIQQSAQYVWLLNNDAIVSPDTLASLINDIQKDLRVGLISPVIYDKSNGNVAFCGTAINFETLQLNTLQKADDYFYYKKKSPNSIGIWGTAMLINREMVEEIGFLDDRFFAYNEDIDYSIRAIDNGWKITIDTDTQIFHKAKNYRGRLLILYYMTRNTLRLILKHSKPRSRFKSVRLYISSVIKRAANFQDKKEIDKSITILTGLWDAITNNYGEWNRQKKIPTIFSRLILWHPYFLSCVIRLGLPGQNE